MADVAALKFGDTTYSLKDAAARASLESKAPLSSPAFTGTPTAPTAAAGTSSAQIATTEFVANVAKLFFAVYGSTNPDDIAAANSAGKTVFCIYESQPYVLSRIRTSDSNTYYYFFSYSPYSNTVYYLTATKTASAFSWSNSTVKTALLASPTFTGTPKAPTASSGTNTKQIATTEFVQTAISGKQASITTSGILKGDGSGGISSATAGTDYGTYSLPTGGIPATDLAETVQISLGKADTALQSQALSGYATESWVGEQGYLTSHQSLSGYATETWVGQQGFLTQHQDVSGKQAKIKVSSVSLSTSWSGSGPYTQTVTVSGSTANSKIDLQPDATAISQLISDEVSALYIANNSGSLTAYAVGAKPTASMTIQCTITEVSTS